MPIKKSMLPMINSPTQDFKYSPINPTNPSSKYAKPNINKNAAKINLKKNFCFSIIDSLTDVRIFNAIASKSPNIISPQLRLRIGCSSNFSFIFFAYSSINTKCGFLYFILKANTVLFSILILLVCFPCLPAGKFFSQHLATATLELLDINIHPKAC